jgi:hypothetical protein
VEKENGEFQASLGYIARSCCKQRRKERGEETVL